MAKINYYINKTNVDKLGFVPIRAKIKNNWYAIDKIKVRYWNPKKQRVIPNRGNEPDNRHKTINLLLDEYQSKANEFFNYCTLKDIPLTDKVIKDFYAGKAFKMNQNNDFDTIFEEFIRVTKTTKTLATVKNRTTVQKFFKAFQEHTKTKLTFYDIDSVFFDSLTDYAYNVRKIKINYFAKVVAVLKTFLNWSAERDYYTGTKHRKFHAPEKNIEIVFLTVEEFQTLRLFTFKDIKLDRVRDIYCFGCLTGLRFSDLMQLKREHIKNGFIEKMIQKVREPAKIPILEMTQKIIDKYNHPLNVLPRISNQKFNDYIKDCCREAGIDQETTITSFAGNTPEEITKPKYSFITAHTSRKTFITLSVILGMDVKTIKSITGHTQDKTFDKYLKIPDEMKTSGMYNSWGKLNPPVPEQPAEIDELKREIEGLKNYIALLAGEKKILSN